MKIKIFILVILVIVVSCFAILQFDTKGYFLFTEEKPGDGDLKRKIFNFDSNLYASGSFTREFSLYFRHRIDGSTVYMAMPERIIPLDNHVALGLQYEKRNALHLGITNNILGRADTIRPYYFPGVDSTMVQKVLTGGNFRWHGDRRKNYFLVDIHYFKLSYDLEYNTKVNKSSDEDVWTELGFGIKPSKKFRIGLGTLFKSDFNSNKAFDYGDHRLIELAGKHSIRMKRARRLCFDWRVSGHYRISEGLYHKGDAEGLATVVYMNPLFKLRKKFFIKGTLRLDLSPKVMKQWYEFVLRKAWKNNSSIDFGYWNVLGSVFPRQGNRFKGVIYLGKLGISPDIQFFWRMDDSGNYRYYRRTFSIEALLDYINRMEIIFGYTYTHFKNLKPFTSRRGVYFGLRKW